MQLVFRPSHRTRLPLRLGFFLWLALNLATQIGLGVIGLTYELGHVQVYQPIISGDVWVTNMTNFQWKYDSKEKSNIFRGAQAHEYGSAAALSYASLYLGPQKSDPSARFYYTDADTSEYIYLFKEYSSAYGNKLYVQTNRSVTITPKCQKIILDHPWPNVNDTIFWKENGRKANFSLPTWLANNTMYSLPDTSVSLHNWCGPRCARLWVLQLVGTKTAPEAYFYQCNSTISQVENAQEPIHNLPDAMAQNLAIAIGLTGYTQWDYPEGTQTQVYNSASPYCPTSLGDESVIENLIAQFSAGAVSELDQSNIRVESKGSISTDGVQLTVKWKYVILLFGLIGIGQLAVSLVIALVANSVIVTEDTTLHIAKYLHAQVSHLGSGGSLLKRTEMAQQIGGKIIYSVSGDNHEDHPDHSYRVGFGPALRKGESKGLRKRSWFPEGRYN